jgi:hypothetical protein
MPSKRVQTLPSLHHHLVVLKGVSDQLLGEVVTALVTRINLFDGEFGGVKPPKPVPANQEVLGSVGEALGDDNEV